MQFSYMSCNREERSGVVGVRQLPNPVVCRAKPANWPNVVFCLVHLPADCKAARYFNEVAYCIHPQRDAIIARTFFFFWFPPPPIAKLHAISMKLPIAFTPNGTPSLPERRLPHPQKAGG